MKTENKIQIDVILTKGRNTLKWLPGIVLALLPSTISPLFVPVYRPMCLFFLLVYFVTKLFSRSRSFLSFVIRIIVGVFFDARRCSG